jgi:NAD+ kinase
MEQFRNIGIIGRLGSSQVLDTVRRLKKFLLDRHLHVILEDTIAEVLPGHGLQTSSRKMLGEVCDMVIVVGGDGSLLGAARPWRGTIFRCWDQPWQPGFPHRYPPR